MARRLAGLLGMPKGRRPLAVPKLRTVRLPKPRTNIKLKP